MSSDQVAISVRNLGKSYVIQHKDTESTAAETLLNYLRNPLKRVEREVVWSLKDVSFDVPKGQIVGFLGRNGAGKSTLLKILSRITNPTEGEARIVGRVGSLIEVGTGFQPELSGRENIFLNGAILGMRRSEVLRRFDEIVDFAGVERYLDTPVKRYSSGMYVRLAFAVAAHLDTEILLVDEILAVGDLEFQKKSIARISAAAKAGRTVIFVSHNVAAMEALCTHGILLDRGRLLHNGTLSETLSQYRKLAFPEFLTDASSKGPVQYGSRFTFFRGADLLDKSGQSERCINVGSKMAIRVVAEADAPLENPTFVIWILNSFGSVVLTLKSPLTKSPLERVDGTCELTCESSPCP